MGRQTALTMGLSPVGVGGDFGTSAEILCPVDELVGVNGLARGQSEYEESLLDKFAQVLEQVSEDVEQR